MGRGWPRQGRGSCLQPHLSIEGREGAGLFLQGGEELWLWETVAKNTPRARGEQEVTWERKSQVLVALGQRWHCHKCGTAAPPQPLQGRVFRAPTGQNWGVPEPQPEPCFVPLFWALSSAAWLAGWAWLSLFLLGLGHDLGASNALLGAQIITSILGLCREWRYRPRQAAPSSGKGSAVPSLL